MDGYNYVMATRCGGAGDLYMMEPVLEALAYEYDPCKLILRTHTDYEWVLKDHPRIWKTIYDDVTCGAYSCPEFCATNMTTLNGELGPEEVPVHCCNFHSIIERFNNLHGVDCWNALADVRLLRRTPYLGYHPTLNHKIVVQTRDRGDMRDLSADDLPQEILHHPQTVVVPPEGLNPYEFKALIAGADMFIGSDSCGLHLAYAAGVPKILGLYSFNYPDWARAYPRMSIARSVEELKRKAVSLERKSLFEEHGFCAHAVASNLQCGGNCVEIHGNASLITKHKDSSLDTLILAYLEPPESVDELLQQLTAKLIRGGEFLLYLIHPRLADYLPNQRRLWAPDMMDLAWQIQQTHCLQVQQYSTYPDAEGGVFLHGRLVA